MKPITCLFYVLLTILANSATFNLKSTTKCITINADGLCTEWSQSGSIDQQTQSCFSQDTLLKTKQGFKKIRNLEIGDMIATIQNGLQSWTDFKGWFHRDQLGVSEYLNVTANGGWFLVSKKHNIALLNQQTGQYYFDFAENLIHKKKLYNSLEKNQVQITSAKGMYSPITSSFTYLVYPSQNSQPILAHNFANIRNPERYEKAVDFVLNITQLLFLNVNGDDGIHVGAKWMMKYFSFLMQ